MDDYDKYRKFEKVLDVFSISMGTLFLSSFVIGIIALISGSAVVSNLFCAILLIALFIGIISLASMAIGVVFGFFRPF